MEHVMEAYVYVMMDGMMWLVIKVCFIILIA